MADKILQNQMIGPSGEPGFMGRIYAYHFLIFHSPLPAQKASLSLDLALSLSNSQPLMALYYLQLAAAWDPENKDLNICFKKIKQLFL